MKKFLKVVAVILGLVLVVAIVAVLIIKQKYGHFGRIPSGGILPATEAVYDVTHYDLNLKIEPEKKFISGRLTMDFTAIKNIDSFQVDLFDRLQVHSIRLNGKPVKWNRSKFTIMIFPQSVLSLSTHHSLTVDYSGKPLEAIYPPWVGGFNWSKDENGNDWVGVSCQGEGAKIWFPCKDHPSDEPDSVHLHFTIPGDYFCASNGVLDSIETDENGWQTYHWTTHYPINNYDITLNIGKYKIYHQTYTTITGDTMPVYYYSLNDGEKSLQLLNMAVDMLYRYRKFYGEYPWKKEKFAIVETDYLGMEHQTINSYGNNYQFDTIQGKPVDNLMLHEMGHEWWGNLVTCADWADFWIHEGICTYGEALYRLDRFGEEAYHKHMRRIKGRIRNNRPVLPTRPATSTEAYNGDIYSKGAALMHSLRFIMGDSAFFGALKKFATDSAFTLQHQVTTDDFIRCFSAYSTDRDISSFINWMLKETDFLRLRLKQETVDSWSVTLMNTDFSLPVEMETSEGIKVYEISSHPTLIKTQTEPIVDPKGWFFKYVKREPIVKQKDQDA